MRAVVHDKYGPPEVLRIEEIPRPVPAADELLVEVCAATVNRTDCHVRKADPILWRFMGTGLLRPKQRQSGSDFAGVVAEVGADVKDFTVGDEVFGTSGYRFGAHAELLLVKETGRVAHTPAGLTFEEAAAIPDGALAALVGLRDLQPLPGKRIVVYGASGALGTAAVQLAKHFGAHVTAVCNTKNVELVRSLGADEVIDYLREDFTRNGQTYDVVLDAVGKHSFLRSRRSLKPGGLYIATDRLYNFVLAPITSLIGSKKVVFNVSPSTKDDLLLVKELVETGKLRPVIDRKYALEDVVEAARYVETGQKTGNVILTLNGSTAR
jgi:NADPH:quinone reductase-like Zn-dependent oxidoreductase